MFRKTQWYPDEKKIFQLLSKKKKKKEKKEKKKKKMMKKKTMTKKKKRKTHGNFCTGQYHPCFHTYFLRDISAVANLQRWRR